MHFVGSPSARLASFSWTLEFVAMLIYGNFLALTLVFICAPKKKTAKRRGRPGTASGQVRSVNVVSGDEGETILTTTMEGPTTDTCLSDGNAPNKLIFMVRKLLHKEKRKRQEAKKRRREQKKVEDEKNRSESSLSFHSDHQAATPKITESSAPVCATPKETSQMQPPPETNVKTAQPSAKEAKKSAKTMPTLDTKESGKERMQTGRQLSSKAVKNKAAVVVVIKKSLEPTQTKTGADERTTQTGENESKRRFKSKKQLKTRTSSAEAPLDATAETLDSKETNTLGPDSVNSRPIETLPTVDQNQNANPTPIQNPQKKLSDTGPSKTKSPSKALSKDANVDQGAKKKPSAKEKAPS